MSYETVLPDTEQVYEQHIPSGERVVLADALEVVKQHGLVRYTFEDHSSADSVIAQALENAYVIRALKESRELRETYPEKIGNTPLQSELGSAYLSEVLDSLVGIPEAFVPANGVLNVYEPGDGFVDHYDLDEKPNDKYLPEEALSLLYVAQGSKAIQFYMHGKSENPTPVVQQAGELYVFQGGGCEYPDGTTRYGLYHGVLPQNEHSTTLSFELTSRNKLDREEES